MQLPSRGLEGDFADLAQMSTLTTVQHALTALQEVKKPQPYSAYLQQVWPFWLQRDPRFRDRQYAEIDAQLARIGMILHEAEQVMDSLEAR